MSSNRWFTKEDILNDLAVVTGIRATNIDDRFAVSGKRPPPVVVPDEQEDEFVQMYGQYSSRDMKAAEPDFSGITHMVRMVNDYYDCATYDDIKNIKELKKATTTVISISKLDPNVPEFFPKNVEKTNSEAKNVATRENTVKPDSSDNIGIKKYTENIDDKHLVCKNGNKTHKTDDSHENKTKDNEIDVTKKINVSSLSSNEIKDISEKLKQKIVCTDKIQCLNKKRERNLAMASLLKLHTDVPKSTKDELSPNLKLMTPEYFQTFPEDVQNNSIHIEVKQIETEENIKDEIKQNTADKHMQPVFNSTEIAHESCFSPMTTSRESINLVSNKKSDSNLEKQKIDFLMTREREESVKKVNKWFDGPEKKKHKPRIYFGQVTFKKKGSSSANSSETQSHSITDITERPSSSQTSDSFVPSAYANELTRSYMKRSQYKTVRHEDIWTKLERELQEKDKLLAKQT